jgi:hypothetical protein
MVKKLFMRLAKCCNNDLFLYMIQTIHMKKRLYVSCNWVFLLMDMSGLIDSLEALTLSGLPGSLVVLTVE